jgi:hypothetical protein
MNQVESESILSVSNILRKPSILDEFDESKFIKKLFIFKKYALNETDGKQTSLAQIIKNLNKEPNSEEQEADTQQTNAPAYAPPFPIGIKLKTKTNPLEIGNHVISTVESNSPADLAGLKVSSRIHKLNDVICDDKTHEFVLFYLNYILRKNTCHSIEMIVDEPFMITEKPVRPRITSRDRQHMDQTGEKTEIISSSTLADPATITASTTTLQETEPSNVQSALAALTKIIGIGTDEDTTVSTTSNEFISLEDHKSSNENLKSIIQSIIWRPPFHKSDGSLFHSESFDSNLSNTQMSISQDDERTSKGIFRELLHPNVASMSMSSSSLETKEQERSSSYLPVGESSVTKIIPDLIGSHQDTQHVSVLDQHATSHFIQKKNDYSTHEASTSSISTSGVHSAFAALTKITTLGANAEEKSSAAVISSFTQQQQEQQKISVINQQFELSSSHSSHFVSDKQLSSITVSQNVDKTETGQSSSSVQSALAALTKITTFGSENINNKLPIAEANHENNQKTNLSYPYATVKLENENLKGIVSEISQKETNISSFKPLPYPYGKEIEVSHKDSSLNDRVVSALTENASGDVQSDMSTEDKPKSIQSALAALTKITSFGSELDTTPLDISNVSYEVLPVAVDKRDQELSESELLKLYRYQGREK